MLFNFHADKQEGKDEGVGVVFRYVLTRSYGPPLTVAVLFSLPVEGDLSKNKWLVQFYDEPRHATQAMYYQMLEKAYKGDDKWHEYELGFINGPCLHIRGFMDSSDAATLNIRITSRC